MSVQAAISLATHANPQYLEAVAVEDLLLQLVERVAGPDAAVSVRRTAEVVEEVLFEVEVGGAQYRLVRSQPLTLSNVVLSPRELAIARLIAQGLPNKTIGTILEISPWTVATHLRRVFTKLDVTSRAAMVARLVNENLL